jgi:kumamolisin
MCQIPEAALNLILEALSTSSTFHDITCGNNGNYNAAPNWDYPTGWGSPNGTNLVNRIKKQL